ncbi:hypothetical protein J2R96_002099 [Bradyrhizobium elkanii]|nr:hypothetical protein [Bradyrhizobium elkanii]
MEKHSEQSQILGLLDYRALKIGPTVIGRETQRRDRAPVIVDWKRESATNAKSGSLFE